MSEQAGKVKLFESQQVRAEWDAESEKWWFSVVDIVAVLTESADAAAYWRKLKQRLKAEGNETVTSCHGLKMRAADGKLRLTDVADTAQILRLVQSIPSKRAEPFKLWLAQVGSERLDETVDPELSIDRAIQNYRRLGYSENWINQPIKSIEVRKALTDEWDKSGVQRGPEYAALTDLMSKTWAGMSTREYKQHKGLKKENLRDNMVAAAGVSAGIGLDALPPVRRAIGSGFDSKTITLSCGKLTTGVTVPQWSSILMLRNLKSPETYFQAAFRVQSPWSIKNPNGDNPNEEEILKPACFVFDFAPTRALRQLSEYGIGLSPGEPNPENAVRDLVAFLPVLAFDGANMTQIDAGGILDIAMAGTSATLLARKWESALLVNVDNGTLQRLLDDAEAMKAIEKIEGWRALGDNIIETIINKSEKVKALKNKAKDGKLTDKEKKELSAEEKEYKSKRKLVQEKLIKFATRIPAFMYLTDFRENTLQDVITKIEPALFQTVTGLTVADFHLLVRLRVFNTEQMNQAVFAFRRYEDASLRYTGIESHEGLRHFGLYDTVVAVE